MAVSEGLTGFSRATREWFSEAFDAPTPVQEHAWESIRAGHDVLVVAPTGSGKTLAAFLWALDSLITAPPAPGTRPGPRVLYVSPLKALGVDVQRNLRRPLAGISRRRRAQDGGAREVCIGIRSGDTPSNERARLLRTPPDILITTPESLYLMLTSRAWDILTDVRTVIVDEVHAVAGTKRGSHLALSLERLDALLERPAQRIGLSATVRPPEEVAHFLAGTHPVDVVAPGGPSPMDVRVVVPVEDMSDLAGTPAPPSPWSPTPDEDATASPGRLRAGAEGGSGKDGDPSIWGHLEASVLEQILRARSTIVFVNSRGLAEKLTARLNELWSRWDAEGCAPPALVEGDTGETPTEPEDAAEHLWRESRLGSTAGTTVRPGRNPIARAHHGSVSKEMRAQVERDLKTGVLRCVVATSSLELGIDMGLVDQVIQVGAPPSVASGLQRVGRAGHHVGATSRGLVYPRTRRDLLDATVTVEAMEAGRIEEIHPPANPLDVLAQHTVAAAVVDDLDVEDWFSVVRRAHPFRGLTRGAFESVLDMLSGRYPSEEFSELRPRLVWDRAQGVLRARPGARRLAVTSGGTIPDRGYYRVVLPEAEGRGGRRVGELDEEMVHESRVGDVIALGAASWRIQEITTDRVVVVPAPGRIARLSFWHGEGVGRPAELGRATGAFIRQIGELLPVDGEEESARESGVGTDRGARLEERLERAGLDVRARRNLVSLLLEQRRATGVVPTERTLVVERCLDEVGDWRVVLHSPYGRRVNDPWALAVSVRLRCERGLDARATTGDDGIVVHLPRTSGGPPGAEVFRFDVGELRRTVVDALGSSALFAAHFRECASRALLLPGRTPGRRSPLWQQRRRASELLSVASGHPGFPIIQETARECLADVYDMSALEGLVSGIDAGEVDLVEVETAVPSPFASTLLFGDTWAAIYDADQPLAERRASLLSLDTRLLAELLGEADLASVLDPEVVGRVEGELQHTAPDRRVRGAEGVADLLRELGPLSGAEVAQRCEEGTDHEVALGELAAQGRALGLDIGGRRVWVAVEDASRLRDGWGVQLPEGIPEVFLASARDPVGDLVERHARTHTVFTTSGLASRLGLGVAVVDAVLEDLRGRDRVVRGDFGDLAIVAEDALEPSSVGGARDASGAMTPAGSDRQWIGTEVLRILRLRSLQAARARTRAVSAPAFVRFLTDWQGVTAHRATSEEGDPTEELLRALDQLAGVALPARVWETQVLPARIPGYSGALLDQLCATGRVVWWGSGAPSPREGGPGLVCFAPAELAEDLVPGDGGGPVESGQEATEVDRDAAPAPASPRDSVLKVLRGGGAYFVDQLVTLVTGELDGGREPTRAEVGEALWDLVWAGRVTNDTFAPVRGLLAATAPGGRRPPARPRRARILRGVPARRGVRVGVSLPASLGGRWSLLGGGGTDPTHRALTRCEVLVARHGILSRGAVLAEDVPGGFADLFPVLRALEDSGRVLRGHFVEGLGGAQFGDPAAVERLRMFDEGVSGARSGGGGGGAFTLGGPDGNGGDSAVVLSALDPANPFGSVFPWPPVASVEAGDVGGSTGAAAAAHDSPSSRAPGVPSRRAGAVVIIRGGHLVAWMPGGGRSLLTFTELEADLRDACVALVGALREGGGGGVSVETVNGVPVSRSPVGEMLHAAGFSWTPSGLRLHV